MSEPKIEYEASIAFFPRSTSDMHAARMLYSRMLDELRFSGKPFGEVHAKYCPEAEPDDPERVAQTRIRGIYLDGEYDDHNSIMERGVVVCCSSEYAPPSVKAVRELAAAMLYDQGVSPHLLRIVWQGRTCPDSSKFAVNTDQTRLFYAPRLLVEIRSKGDFDGDGEPPIWFKQIYNDDELEEAMEKVEELTGHDFGALSAFVNEMRVRGGKKMSKEYLDAHPDGTCSFIWFSQDGRPYE